MNENPTIQDFAASVVAVSLVLGSIILGILQRPVPPEMSTSLGAAITWLFVRSTQQAEHKAVDNKVGGTAKI